MSVPRLELLMLFGEILRIQCENGTGKLNAHVCLLVGGCSFFKMIMRVVSTVTTLLCYSLRLFVHLPLYCVTVHVGLYSYHSTVLQCTSVCTVTTLLCYSLRQFYSYHSTVLQCTSVCTVTTLLLQSTWHHRYPGIYSLFEC